MLIVALRKTLKNPWLSVCLLCGFIMAAAVTCSIPMYAGSAPLKYLSEEFGQVAEDSGKFPAYWSAGITLKPENGNLEGKYNDFLKRTRALKTNIPLPTLGTADTIAIKNVIQIDSTRKSDLNSFDGLENYTRIISGKMCSGVTEGGVMEAVVSENDMLQSCLALGKTYFIPTAQGNIGVKIVGIVKTLSPEKLAWYEDYPFDKTKNAFYVDYDLLKREFIQTAKSGLTMEIQTYSAYDYREITSANLKTTRLALANWIKANGSTVFKCPMIPLLDNYKKQETSLLGIMFVLNLPILFMILLLICTVSCLIADHDRTEIAVIASRGGRRRQVALIYLLQGVFLGAAALLAGPPAGFLICRIIGASGDFMDLKYDPTMPIAFNGNIMLYALGAVLVNLLAMLLTTLAFTDFSVVQQKQKRVRSGKYSSLPGLAIGLLLLGLSLYWRFTGKISTMAGAPGDPALETIPLDPLLVINAVVFIAGISLIMLFVFPYFINILFYAGKRIWSPMPYLAFVQTGRNRDMKQLFMLFFLMAFAVGLFNSNTARTVDRNISDSIMYKNGADQVLQEKWEGTDPDKPNEGDEMAAAFGDAKAAKKIELYNYRELAGKTRTIYKEPDFSWYAKQKGVISSARVFYTDDAVVNFSRYPGLESDRTRFPGAAEAPEASDVEMFAVNTREFGNTAWFRGDLLSSNWYVYLNQLGEQPNGVLLSRSFEQDYGVKKGDFITATFSNTGSIKAKVVDFLQYWPGFEPVSNSGENRYLTVMNLGYMQTSTPLLPYQVWLKTDGSVSAQALAGKLKAESRLVQVLSDSRMEVNKKLREPVIQVFNGALSLGLVLILAVSMTGFLIYWVLSIKRRELQFGMLRSFGVEFRSILGMLALEQLLTSLSSVAGGILIGQLATKVYLPVMGSAWNGAGQLLPFLITLVRSDYDRFIWISIVMLLAAMLILGRIISRIRIAQVIKLGEE
ncbi:MAG TPA: ABC transporter permease [Clostridia bacterium]|nr:ABC transporter permease [Clostridia bacterium]